MYCDHKNAPPEFRYCPCCGERINPMPTFEDLIAHHVTVGDEIWFKLKDGTNAAVVVVDKDDNDVRCAMFEGMEPMAMYDSRHWEVVKGRDINYFESDAMRKYEQFKDLLPNELLDIIKPRTFTQGPWSSESKRVALYPLSAYEVFGKKGLRKTYKEYKDEPIRFFTDSVENRKKYLWCSWLRSPHRGGYTFTYVTKRGHISNQFAYISYSLVPTFTI